MTHNEAIDFLLEHFTSEEFSEEVQSARLEFNELTGGPFDQMADGFEMKMSQFADWFLFERPNQSLGERPIDSPEAEALATEKGFIDQLKSFQVSRNSIFEFLKVRNEDLYVKDLLANEKLVVPGSSVTLGFQRDEYFQARLFESDSKLFFGPAFCFHPSQATRYLAKETRRVRKIKDEDERLKENKELLMRVFKMKYKLHQYKHVDPKDIYSQEPKLRF